MSSDSALRRAAGALLCLAALASAPARAGNDPFEALAAVPPLTGIRADAPGFPLPCQPAESGKPLGLAEVVDAALCHNPQTREAWANARAQAAQVGIARSAYLPALSASASASRNWSDARTAAGGGSPFSQQALGLDAAYVLYDFGARDAGLETARQIFAASAATRDATVQAVFLGTVQAFFQERSAGAALEAAVQSEKAALESLNAAEARYRVGVATPADRLQARTAHAQAVLNRISAEGALKIARGTLANVIGMDPTRPLTLAPVPPAAPDVAFEADVAHLIDEARARRPDLAAAEADFRAARANIDAARSSGMPTISLGAGLARIHASGSPTQDSSTIGLSVSIPLFTGYASTYRVRVAEAQADSQAARRDLIRLQVALDVWNAYANLGTASQSVRSAEDLLASATESERVAAGRYRAGVGSILDLLTAQAALASARQQRVQAGFGWFTARAVLAQAMGALDGGMLGELTLAPNPSPAPLSPSPSPASGRGESTDRP